jgi:hypothetical protein
MGYPLLATHMQESFQAVRLGSTVMDWYVFSSIKILSGTGSLILVA